MKLNRNKNLSLITSKWPIIYVSVILLIGLIVVTGIMYIILSGRLITSEMQLAMGAAVVLVIIALTNSFSLIRIRADAKIIQGSYNSLKESYEKTTDLNDTLREQRHDFLNHIQIIHSLIEMENYSEASEYMDTIYEEIQSVGKILKTSCPAVNALLQVKNHSCEQKNIEFRIISTTKLEFPSMEPWDICGILGNLIDNAIHAAENVKNGKILVSLREDFKNYILKVKDNGAGISKEIADKVFDMGFTTKGTDGQGIGLAVSKKKLKSHGGDIKFITSKKGTVFTVSIPRKIQQHDLV